MAIKKNAKKNASTKPAKKASLKRTPAKKVSPKKVSPSKTAEKKSAPASKKAQPKKASLSKSQKVEKRKEPVKKVSARAIEADADFPRDDVAAYNEDQPLPQDEDAEASAFAASDEDNEAEAEARVLDLDEVAEAAQLEDRAPADDADLPDAEDLDDPMGIDDVMPLPATGYGDDFDPDDVMAMSAFQSRSVLGAEERNAVIQEVKQRAEKNGGYVTYDELNQIVPATVQDESTADEYLLILQALNVDVIRAEDVEAYRANKDKQGDSRLHAARVQEMFDDPIRMYLH